MSLRHLDLKPQYDSMTDDVYENFFNKVLKHSVECVRVGGRFTSRNFAACAEGMQEFIQADGRMRLVLLPEFTEEDSDAINQGISKVHDVLSEKWIRDLSEVRDRFVEDHTKALAWMLANEHLEIKIVVPVGRDGSVVSSVKMYDSQIFRNKTGVFWDKNHDAVSFSGNIEFDDKVMGEYYQFRVYRGWDKSELRYVNHDWEEFHKYWDGQEISTEIMLKTLSLPDAVKDSLLRIAPKSKSEIRLQSSPKLRPYQKEAVHLWNKNGGTGVFEMATGTGKTFAAIGCIEQARKEHRLLVVVVCPFDNLERQWERELAKWDIESTVTSGRQNWHQILKDKIASLEVSKNGGIAVVITTYRTFSSDKFIRTLGRCRIPTMLVADEVHNVGSPSNVVGLIDAYEYRLGLSATLERYFDPDGTKLIRQFFGKTVYEMDLKSAIENRFLVGYHYYPIITDLNDEEYEKYRAYTVTIAKLWNSKKPEQRERLERAILARSRIIRDAVSKLHRFREWTEAHKANIKYVLAYCSENQMIMAKHILNSYDIVNREITAKNPSDPRQRVEILSDFSAGRYNVIVANRVLDEGVDVPAAKICIMLASTGNPKQFIQRRGRVLRKFMEKYGDGSHKEHADIYDVLVIPSLSPTYTVEEIKIERQIVASQIGRLENMAMVATNKDECMKVIDALKTKFALRTDHGT